MTLSISLKNKSAFSLGTCSWTLTRINVIRSRAPAPICTDVCKPNYSASKNKRDIVFIRENRLLITFFEKRCSARPVPICTKSTNFSTRQLGLRFVVDVEDHSYSCSVEKCEKILSSFNFKFILMKNYM